MPALSVSNPHYRVVFCASRAWLSEPFRKGDVLLIALGGKAQSAIKQLVQQSQQFHLAINFDRAAHDALALQESPEMPLGESNCPAQVGKGDPLGARRSPSTLSLGIFGPPSASWPAREAD